MVNEYMKQRAYRNYPTTDKVPTGVITPTRQMDVSNPKVHAIMNEKIPMLLGHKDPLFASTRTNMPPATWHNLMAKTSDVSPTHQQVLD